MRRTPLLPNVPRELYNTPLGDFLNRMRQALDALTDDGGILEGGSDAYFALTGNNTATGTNLFSGTNTFQGLSVFTGGSLAVENNFGLSSNNVLGMVLGSVNSQDPARFGGVWVTVGFRAAPTDGDDPEDGSVTYLRGAAVYADAQVYVTPLDDTIPRAHRFSGSYAPRRQLAGIIVSDDFPQGAWVIRKGPADFPDWTALTGAADLVPGKTYFVTYATGDSGAGTYTTTPTPWPVGKAVNARRLYVDVDGFETGEVVWMTTAGTVKAGQPVYPSSVTPGQLELAEGTDILHQARLVALLDGTTGDVIPCSAQPCVVVRDDWTSVAGVATLTAGDVWWLDNNATGHPIVLEADLNTAAAVQQELGYALSSSAMLFSLRPPASGGGDTHYDGGAAATVFGPASHVINGGGA